jgi:hypothetical protein
MTGNTDHCQASVERESWVQIGHHPDLVDVEPGLVPQQFGEQRREFASAVAFSYKTMDQRSIQRVTLPQPNLGHRCCHSSAVQQLHALALAQVLAMVRRPHARLAFDDA